MRNEKFHTSRFANVTVTAPATPVLGGPVRVGTKTGVATRLEGSDGKTSVDYGPFVVALAVIGKNSGGNSAVVYGDQLFLNSAATEISKDDTGYWFGYANGAVDSGATTTIDVDVQPGTGPGTADILAGAITNDMLDGGITGNKLAAADFGHKLVNGGAAGDITVTGIAVGDELLEVLELPADGFIDDLVDLTSEFTVAAGKINNTGGTNTTGNKLLVRWIDKTP